MSVRNVSVEVDVASVAEVFGELTDEQRWVCWRAEDRGGRPTKVPYQPDGRRASSTDPTTWSTLHDAVQAHVREGYSGIGIVLGRGLGGVDLDACRNPETGEIAGWARGAIEEFHSYTEISPSGTGVKILARGAPAALPASVLPMSGELTDSIEEHAFVFGYGTGANGKGVFTGTVQGVLGDYANTVPTEMLMVTRNERHPTELARLGGVRLAIGSETEVDRTWAQGRIKSLTGGDRIAARFMRQDFFEFDPTFKLFIVGNDKPFLRGVDEAIRRRLHLVPFIVKIPAAERDPKLSEKLRAEWPGILRWAIDGCLEWQERGLDPPGAVLAATDEYLGGEDAVGRWLEECTTKDPQGWESAADLYESWWDWAVSAGEFVISKKRLGQELQDRGFKSHKRSNQRGYRGLMLGPGGGPES